MNRDKPMVKDYIRLSKIFVSEDETLFKALELMKNNGVDNISIVKNNCSIVGCINKFKILNILTSKFNNNINTLKNTKISEQNLKLDFPIILYPDMSIFDAYMLMKCFNNNYLPIIDVPWEKKIVGFLWLKDILPIVEETYVKVPV
jgi:predicted transcriptional regulator